MKKKHLRCPKCRYKKPASKFRSGCSVCDRCERFLREEANGGGWRGAIPHLTPAEKRLYSRP